MIHSTKHHYEVYKHLWLAFLGIVCSMLGIFLSNRNTFASDTVTISNYDQLFVWAFSGLENTQTNLHRQYGGNDFRGLIFRRSFADVDATVTLGDESKTCSKQIRWLYYNSQRWNAFWPLDADTLTELQSLHSGYNNLEIQGGLFTDCDGDTQHVYGQIVHTYDGGQYIMNAWTDVDTANNVYTLQYDTSLTITGWLAQWYIVDSIGGIASVEGLAPTIDGEDTWTWDNDTWGGDDDSWSGDNNSGTWDDNQAPSPWHSNGWGGFGTPHIYTDQETGICGQRDCSDSYYDAQCGVCTDATGLALPSTKKPLSAIITDHTEFVKKISTIMSTMQSSIDYDMVGAYVFAKELGITTVSNIDQAQLLEPLLRKHLAKMISVYAIKVLNMQPDTTRACGFADMQEQDPEMQYYATLACQLGIMGLESDGKTPKQNFVPNDSVDRAQFGTVLSRVLYGEKNNTNTSCRYCTHLKALQKAAIMKKIDAPSEQELRGYVMLMMWRAYQQL